MIAEPAPPVETRPWRPGRWVGTYLADVAAVCVFIYLGLGAHGTETSVAEMFRAALPFLIVRTLLLAYRNRPHRVWPGGVVLWVVTWAGGMVLRALLGGGTALAFVLVALGVLGVLMLAWRAIVALIGHVRLA